jgi:hypothetical protein
MTPFTANPTAYVLSIIAIGAVVLYFAYGVIDRMGLEVRAAVATVTGKQFNPGGVSYNTSIAGGRAWTQSQETAETYVVTLTIGTEPTVGLVSKQLFDTVNAGDKVNVRLRRTRITRRLEVVEIAK